MTTSLNAPALKSVDATTDSSPKPTQWPGWVREPLLHFLVIGAVLFAADHVLQSQRVDPHTIVMGAQVDEEARAVFKAARGRDPNTEELQALRRVWLDNEVLYREGLALEVDKGDATIRERVIFKTLSVLNANVKPPPLDGQLLREWFEKNRSKYDEPMRFDFQEAVLSGNGSGSESAVRAFVLDLNAGTPGDAQAGLRVFKGRPKASLAPAYGEDFARLLEKATPGEWRAMPTLDGWRAVRLLSISPGKPAAFEPLRGVALHDWTDTVMAERRTAAVRALAAKYTVKIEEAAP